MDIKTTENNNFIIVVIILLISTMFLSSGFFVEARVIPKWYAFIVSVLSCALVMHFSTMKILEIDTLYMVLFVFVGYILIRGLVSSMSTLDILSLTSFLLLCLFFRSIKYTETYIDLIIVVVCLFQAIYGVLQFAGIEPSHNTFRINGSFDNPAGIAVTLAVGFPFIFNLPKHLKTYNLLSLIAIVLIGGVIILSGSRAGLVSIGVISTIFLHDYLLKHSNQFKRYIIPLLSVLGSFAFVLLIFLKQDSAVGRLLIWKISGSAIQKNLIFGSGDGSFLAQYMELQANYFADNPESKYAIIADSVSHPFNEYLRLVMEYGIVGLVLLTIGIIFVLKSTRLSSPHMLCLLSMGIVSLFSYPLKYPFTWALIAYSLAQINKDRALAVIFQFQLKWFKLLAITIMCVGIVFLIRDIKFEYHWNSIAKRSLSGRTREMMHQYQELFNSWNGNHLFLYNFGAELNHIRNYKESINILHQCILFWDDYDIQMLFADNYFNLHEFDEAKRHYTKALNMCPNRFVPLYKLHKISLEENRIDEATNIAHAIMRKKVKVPSSTVLSIKGKMKRYLKGIKLNKL